MTLFERREHEARRLLEQYSQEYEAFVAHKLKPSLTQEGLQEETLEASQASGPYHDLDRTEYRMVTFDGLSFGKTKASSVEDLHRISGIRFFYCNFTDCTFCNVQFENCTFVGCTFKECYTSDQGLTFEHCGFYSLVAGKKSTDDMHVTFVECELAVRFSGCDLTHAVFHKTNFYFSQFSDTRLNGAIVCDCTFDTVTFSDCNFCGSRIIGTKFMDFTLMDRVGRSRVDRHSFFGELVFNRSLDREVRFAREVYCALNELFESNSVTSLSGEYFYLFKKTELLQLDRASKAFSYAGLLTCGYGERPFFSLLVSAAIVILCGCLYVLFGISTGAGTLVFHPTLAHPLPEWSVVSQCLHFSLVTFSTTGYGNVTPVGWSMGVSAAEMVMGVIMVGVFVSTLVRKMAR